jgi:hypothetical protein
VTTSIELSLKQPGKPYWERPDIGLDPEDIKIANGRMTVTVHSLGAVDAPASSVTLRDAGGKVVATATAGGMKAPLDLEPKATQVTLHIPTGFKAEGSTVILAIPGVQETTLLNNEVTLE